MEERQHESHTSPWPVVIGISIFVLLIGLSGIREGGLYFTITIIGFIGSILSFLGLGMEKFSAPEPDVGERWPFEGVEKEKLGVWIFLASDIVLFGAFIGSYLFIRIGSGWTEWDVIVEDPLLGLLNTYFLLTSSFAVVLALVAAEIKSKKGVIASLLGTLVLGIAFLINKGLEWDHLFHQGHTFSSSVEASTFYITTGLHGAHVIGGLAILLFLLARSYKGTYLGEEESRPIEYFGLYWHFVDIVWIFLFPLFYLI